VSAVWGGFFEESYLPDSCPPSSAIHLKFPARENMPAVDFSWYDGGIMPKRPEELGPDEPMGDWNGGMIFEGTKGKLIAGMWGKNPKWLPASGEWSVHPSISSVEGGTDGHQQQWVKACKEGFGAYTSSPFDMAGPLTETVIMGNLAVRSHNYREPNADGKGFSYPGRKQLLWDGKNMEITNFDVANQFVTRDYRKGW